MKLVVRAILAFSIFATLSVFYLVGISRFPDYENYLRLAKGIGFLVSEHDYLFEWLSRFILGFSGISDTNKVELLAVLNQIVCVVFFVWIGLKSRSDRVYGALFVFCLFGFLFMTTTLRASSAYLCISAFFLRGARFDFPGVGLLVFSMAWHDSAVPVVFICFVAQGLSYCTFRYRIREQVLSWILRCIVIGSGAIVLSTKLLHPLFSNLMSRLDLGVRAAYLGDGAYSLSKLLFVLFGIFICFNFVSDTRQSLSSRLFISLMSMVVGLSHMLSGVVSVRFAIYIFLVILPLRGIFVFEFERKLEVRILALMISPLVFYLSTLYVFSNTL